MKLAASKKKKSHSKFKSSFSVIKIKQFDDDENGPNLMTISESCRIIAQ